MRHTFANGSIVRSEMLADALGETIGELRLIDLGDMIAYIRAERWANVADLVQSSAELFFEDGTLSFAWSGDCRVGWGVSSRVALDLEMQTRELTAFFTLSLEESGTEIQISNLLYATPPADEAMATRIFAQALSNARRIRR